MDVISPVGNVRRGLFLVGMSAIELLGRESMLERETIDGARKDPREENVASTRAGEFVREIRHVREGKHAERSTKRSQASIRLRHQMAY